MTDKARTILIVDDDPAILKYLSKSLPSPDNLLTVLTANSGPEALEILSQHDIFMVISDIRMEAMSGIHLLNEIRSNYDHVKTVLMTAYDTEDIKNQISQSGCLQLLSKPIKAENLREIINEVIKKQEQGFAGTLKNIQLTDIIQMCCYSEVNMAIRVTKDEQQGTIYITGGNIVHATCKNKSGEAAFYEIMDWKSGSFETLSVDAIPKETIEKNWEFLLIEASRKEDEQQMDTADLEQEDAADDAAADNDLGFELGDDTDVIEQDALVTSVLDEEDIADHQEFNDKQILNVLIVDDSSMMIKILADILSMDGDINVVGSAKNGEEALKQIELLNPDLITLDVNMPIMDGSTALKHIMIKTPCPVVIISNPGKRSQLNIVNFLRLGAVDFIKKPARSGDLNKQHMEIVQTIRQAASANISNFRRARVNKNKKIAAIEPANIETPCRHLVIINSGSGGHGEVIKLISMIAYQKDICILILQKMPNDFSAPFAEFFNENSEFHVLPIEAQQPLCGGRCYIGSHDHHLSLQREGQILGLKSTTADLTIEEQDESVDRFLLDVADNYEGQLSVVYLSGASTGSMAGLKNVKSRQGHVIIQKSDECMVSGPLEKIRNTGLFNQEADLTDIARHICPANP